MRIVTPVKLLTLSVLIAVASGTPAIALVSTTGQAHAQSATVAHTNSTDTSTDTTSTTMGSTKAAAAKANHTTRLAAIQLRVCQHRQKAITNIMSRIADRGQKQLDLFTTIATKTENFYAKKGKTLSTYDTLLAAVNDKKAAAQTTVDSIKADSVTFNCGGTDPKGAVTTFKTALQSEIQALKDYKTAVKNLIVGVKSVQSTTVPANSTTTTTGETQTTEGN